MPEVLVPFELQKTRCLCHVGRKGDVNGGVTKGQLRVSIKKREALTLPRYGRLDAYFTSSPCRGCSLFLLSLPNHSLTVLDP